VKLQNRLENQLGMQINPIMQYNFYHIMVNLLYTISIIIYFDTSIVNHSLHLILALNLRLAFLCLAMCSRVYILDSLLAVKLQR